MKYSKRILLFITVIFLFSGCHQPVKEKIEDADLTIYCENGILGPIKEIADQYEENSGLNIEIQNDCARNLVSMVHYRNEADVFIPDTRHTIDNIASLEKNFFSDSVFLGYQSLMFFVPKENPENFDGKLQSLLNPSNGIVLANPESSTLGMVTGITLKQHNLYDQVMNSVLFFTTDSRGLIRSIATNQASVAMGWKSDPYLIDPFMAIDTIHIHGLSPEKRFHKAIAVIPEKAPNKEEARKFLKILTSGNATSIFKKYGIFKDPVNEI
ncbi:MAG: substrate-binding domain-containing protein [Marinilabilia sp.]